MEKYRIVKHADSEMSEMILMLEQSWLKTEDQISFLREIWDTLPNRYQVHLHTVLVQFNSKIQQATVLIDGFIGKSDDDPTLKGVMKKKGSVQKLNLALGKRRLMDAINDCRKWQDMVDPSWFLLRRLSSAVIDQQVTTQELPVYSDVVSALRTERDSLCGGAPQTPGPNIIKSNSGGFDYIEGTNSIPFSSSKYSYEPRSGRDLIIDSFVPSPLADREILEENTRDLAKILASIDLDEPRSGLLSCVGVSEKMAASERPPEYEFAFAVPKRLQRPRSLRELLIASHQTYPLDDRIELARFLARSVLSLHTYRFVHKNIRPETIVVFQDGRTSSSAPFLVGFETFRPAGGKSYLIGDSCWEKNLYRHPKRQGTYPEEEYKMQHDVYSIGVCLLEIGIWSNFVVYEPHPSPSAILNIADKLTMKAPKKRAFDIKDVLVNLARMKLPGAMGHRYTDIVVSCLTCLDKTDNTFGDENDFMDTDGISVGVQFIEKVRQAHRPSMFKISSMTDKGRLLWNWRRSCFDDSSAPLSRSLRRSMPMVSTLPRPSLGKSSIATCHHDARGSRALYLIQLIFLPELEIVLKTSLTL